MTDSWKDELVKNQLLIFRFRLSFLKIAPIVSFAT